jgi:hypothetical protein
MSDTPPIADSLHHHSRRMGGRDPHEAHRAAAPLELLFDLTFVVVCLPKIRSRRIPRLA